MESRFSSQHSADFLVFLCRLSLFKTVKTNFPKFHVLVFSVSVIWQKSADILKTQFIGIMATCSEAIFALLAPSEDFPPQKQITIGTSKNDCKIGDKHLMKIVTHLCRDSTKIMKQSKQALTEQTTKN